MLIFCHRSILPSPSLATTHAWITGCHALPNNWNFAIELLPTPSSTSTSPRVIGLIGAVRAPEIGYMLNYTYWGKGYATEALQAFLPLFFGHYQEAEYAEALTDPELASSRNVLRKAGFVVVEERKGDFENPVLGVRDTVVWRIGRGEVMG
jgi:RimJ/RimL family protein N-acetyltransferase